MRCVTAIISYTVASLKKLHDIRASGVSSSAWPQGSHWDSANCKQDTRNSNEGFRGPTVMPWVAKRDQEDISGIHMGSPWNFPCLPSGVLAGAPSQSESQRCDEKSNLTRRADGNAQ